MYHRVAEVEHDPWSLAVTTAHFAEHVEALRQRWPVVTLRELEQAMAAGRRLEPSIAITFDDGYSDTLHRAKPWLERFAAPATVFVTAGWVDAQRSFWWDALDCVLVAEQVPDTLRLIVGDREHQWSLDPSDAPPPPQWRIARDTAAHPRQKLYLALHDLLRPLDDEARQPVIDQLLIWAGADRTDHSARRPLTSAEVRALTRDGLVDIGSHTMTHPDLSVVSRDVQQTEITRSRLALEEMVEQAVTSFAYPYGARRPETRTLVQAAGYVSACLAEGGPVSVDSDRYELPRVMVEDWDGDELTRRVAAWLS